MSYLFKEKFNIGDLVNIQTQTNRVVICEPEDYLAALYAHYLSRHNFDIKHCPQVETLTGVLKLFSPRILVFNVDAQKSGRRLILGLRRQFPGISVITVGYNTSGELIKELMSAGVSGHIDRRLSKPKDLIHIVKAVLNTR